MKKYQYLLIYLTILVLPVTIVYITSLYREFDIEVVQSVVFGMSLLLATEIDAKYKSKKFLWYYISSSSRDKLAFMITLIVFYTFLIYPAINNILLSSTDILLWILTSVLLAGVTFIIFSSPKMRNQFLTKIFDRLKSR